MPTSSKAQQAQDAARIHTELGQRYLASGDLQTALEKLTLALKFDPNYAPAHTVIAVLYERIHKLPEAELHYRKAVELEPTKGAANNNLGQFLCSTGKYAEATDYFQKAVADPFNNAADMALTNEGVCQLRAGDVAGAEASFRDAIARNPNSAEALFQLANTLYLHNDAFRARAFIQRFDALGQPSAGALKLGYDIETRLGNPEGAQNYSMRLRSQFPDSEQARALNSTASP
jgi:type IV pilus assembly protein PilF